MRDVKNVRSFVPSALLRAQGDRAWLVAPLLAASVLSACVVVPVDTKTGQQYGHEPQPSVVVVQQPSASPASAPAAPHCQCG